MAVVAQPITLSKLNQRNIQKYVSVNFYFFREDIMLDMKQCGKVARTMIRPPVCSVISVEQSF